VGILALSGCSSIVRRVSMEKRPLTFVGQVSFGTPQVHKSSIVVPVTFAGGEWGLHSAIALHHIDCRIADHAIEMTVFTSLVGDNPAPQELRLSRIASGQHSVTYCDPDGRKHSLGQIEIPKTR
jgi:hypothetical protein